MPAARLLRSWKEALLHLFYPHHCLGCGTDGLHLQSFLCPSCLHHLPRTYFEQQSRHHLQQMLESRLAVQHSSALWYFGKKGPLHNVMEAMKYRRLPEAGVYLGEQLGAHLFALSWAASIDAIVPLPLNARKQAARGYNQAERLAAGVGRQLGKPVLAHALLRNRFTNTQTKLDHQARWHNMAEVFALGDAADALAGKHILLVDDVITTGATIEHAGRCLLQVPGLQLSVAAAAYTSHR